MRRALILLFTLLLPLQFAWGAVTSYCGHETGSARNHFGHHEHVHKADPAKKTHSAGGQDNDCGTCHATALPALTSATSPVLLVSLTQGLFLTADSRPVPAPDHKPERPKWARLA